MIERTSPLFFEESGPDDGAMLVFLHGLGVSGWMWTEQVAALRERYRCLVIDLPGNGESHALGWRSLADAADQVMALVHERRARAHLIGLSLGGYTALHALARHPDQVASAIVSGVATEPLTQQWLWRSAVKVMTSPLRDAMLAAQAKTMALPPEAAQLYRRDGARLSQQTIERIYDEVLQFRLPPPLQGLPTPVLAVAGDAEVGAIKSGLRGFKPVLPNSIAAIVPKAHHGWNAEHPELFNAMVRAWVERCEVAPGLRPSDGASPPPDGF
jgi:pimeloyl-ACP methyl ester carboxylesterase